jgi:hypothetical protein
MRKNLFNEKQPVIQFSRDPKTGREVVEHKLMSLSELCKFDNATGLKVKLTRLEVIDKTGRAYAAYGKITLSHQDEGRTLKIFVEESEEAGKEVKNNLVDSMKEVLGAINPKTPHKYQAPDSDSNSDRPRLK